MAKYFVTGATGFIGGEIVKQLIGRGHKVVALVRSPAKASMLKALGVEIHAGDITDRETLTAPMTGVDRYDERWIKIKRPIVVVGGEMTIDSTDKGTTLRVTLPVAINDDEEAVAG